MNGDMQDLMTYIGQGHKDLRDDIAELSARFSEHKGRTDANLLATEFRLNGLEAEHKQIKTRQWIHTVIILPIIGGLHAIAKHFGY